jgi:hypothetical protein
MRDFKSIRREWGVGSGAWEDEGDEEDKGDGEMILTPNGLNAPLSLTALLLPNFTYLKNRTL